jgi:hypothetical protein
MECSHPKAVEMKNLDWNISRFHAFEEGIDCDLVVICGEACAKPKTITPTGDFSRFARQNGVLLQDFLGSWAVDDVPTSISLRSIPIIWIPNHFNRCPSILVWTRQHLSLPTSSSTLSGVSMNIPYPLELIQKGIFL